RLRFGEYWSARASGKSDSPPPLILSYLQRPTSGRTIPRVVLPLRYSVYQPPDSDSTATRLGYPILQRDSSDASNTSTSFERRTTTLSSILAIVYDFNPFEAVIWIHLNRDVFLEQRITDWT
ncbi:hypothetical protein, partial [Natronococcus pandeyae]|uniref:hypothetical protein n=1 Tax=Natronococcus pandeyae TaxID=2055836 RepID=UPI001CA38397